MRTVNRYLVSQFGNPRGPVGALVGTAMAVKNRRRIAWAVSRLDLASTDHVLEIGFGPGVSLKRIAALTPKGSVAGIEKSPLMVRQASRRLAGEIREGRVVLHAGDVCRIPYPDGTFTRALAVNSMMFWPRPAEAMAEIRRVLAPGGRLVVVTQPWGARTDEAVTRAGESIRAAFARAGFEGITLETLPARQVPCLGVIGTRPS